MSADYLVVLGTGQKVWGVDGERGGSHEVLSLVQGWVVQFSATLRGWVTLFYYIDRH